MKKNYLLGMFAAAGMLLATSCSNDELEVQSGNEAQVSFSLGLEGGIGSRTISDGTGAKKLICAVYDANSQVLDQISINGVTVDDNGQYVDSEAFDGGLTDQINVTLAKGQTYTMVFWAQNPNCDAYDTDDLKAVEINYAGVNNAENRDAFFAAQTFKVSGNAEIDVTLKRPFAQINVGVTEEDWNAAVASGIEIAQSSVEIKNAANSINLLTGEVKGNVSVPYSLNTIPNETLYVETDATKEGKEAYRWISMSYILVNDVTEQDIDKDGTVGDERATLEGLQYTFAPKNGTNIEFKEGLAGAPVQRNWRTNILGKLLTGDILFNITIDPVYDDDYIYPEKGELEQELELAATFGGTVTLTDNVELKAPLNVTADMVIDLDGFTISGTWHKNDGAVIKNSANLKLIGGTVSSIGENGGSALQNNGIAIVEGTTLNGAPNANGSWPSYTVNNTGTLTLNNSKITSYHGAVASYGDNAVVTLNNSEIDMAGIPGFTSHGIYTYNSGKVVVNGGTYANKATDQNASGASVINGNVEVNAGNFAGRIENYYGTPVLKGGTYSVKPNNNFVASGYKVLNSNGKFVVVTEEIDAAYTSQEDLKNATFADNTVIALTKGEYVLPDAAAGKIFTIKGTDNPEDVVLVAENDGASEGNCDYSLRDSKVTFNNVTITTTGTYFPGYAYMEGTFNNCIINGVYTVYKSSSFNDCTFNIEGDLYNLWTWGGEEVNLNNCTFNCDGKAVLLYGQANTKLTINNCTFNDNGTIADKAAIEIGNDYNTSYELTVNNTVVNGFDINPKGYNTGTTLWANKNSMKPENLKVTVDGKNAYIIVASDTDGIKAAIAAGTTVVGLADGNYDMTQLGDLRGKTLTLVGTKNAVIDASAVDARNQFVTGATLAFEGVTLNFGKVNYMGFANTASLTYKDCQINGLQFLFGENVTFENCDLNSNGAEHSVWTYGAKNVSFEGCDFTYGDRGINCYSDNDIAGGKQTVNFTNCTFATENTASEGAVEINSCFFSVGIEVNMEGCTAPAYGKMAYVSPWDSTNGAKTTINIK